MYFSSGSETLKQTFDAFWFVWGFFFFFFSFPSQFRFPDRIGTECAKNTRIEAVLMGVSIWNLM